MSGRLPHLGSAGSQIGVLSGRSKLTLSATTYQRSARMKMNPWITYRTRFLVKAKQLTTSLAFTDVFGREHSGRKGDYLVEWSDGVLRIAPRKIFEDIYVPLPEVQKQEAQVQTHQPTLSRRASPQPCDVLPYKRSQPEDPSLSISPLLVKKYPQPCLDRRSPRPGVSSL
jgi:hypothetical protein